MKSKPQSLSILSTLKTKVLSTKQKQEILNLWNTEYPLSIQHKDAESLEIYLSSISEPTHYFRMNSHHQILAWLVCFNRNGERFFAMIINGNHQKKGIGKRLLQEVQTHEKELYGWVVDKNNYTKQNGEAYPSPVSFYQKMGFTLLPNIRMDTDQLCTVKIMWQKSNVKVN